VFFVGVSLHHHAKRSKKEAIFVGNRNHGMSIQAKAFAIKFAGN